jgi:hypothetical protein
MEIIDEPWSASKRPNITTKRILGTGTSKTLSYGRDYTPYIQTCKITEIKDLIAVEDTIFRRVEDIILKSLECKNTRKAFFQEKKEVSLKRKVRRFYAQAFRLEQIDYGRYQTIYFVFHDEKAFQKLINACRKLMRISRHPAQIMEDITLYRSLRKDLPHPGDEEYSEWVDARQH